MKLDITKFELNLLFWLSILFFIASTWFLLLICVGFFLSQFSFFDFDFKSQVIKFIISTFGFCFSLLFFSKLNKTINSKEDEDEN